MDEWMDDSREMFEDMTRINNELLNTRRLLEKQKARIEELNGELERRNGLLSSLLGSIREAVIGLDAAGAVVFLNRSAEGLTGWEADEAAGRSVGEVLVLRSGAGVDGEPHSDGDPLYGARRAIAGGSEWSFPSGTHVAARGGRWTPVAGSVMPVAASGPAGRGSLMVLRDITEEQKAQKALLAANRLEVAEGIASGILHTYNTLLMVMVNNARSLRIRFADDADIEKVVGRIEEASGRAEALSDRLIQFTRSDVYAAEPVDLNTIVGEVADAVRRGAGDVEKGVEVELSLADDLPPVRADAEMMRRLVEAILDNAMDALRPAENEGAAAPSGAVRIRTENADGRELPEELDEGEPARFVLLAVADDGCGMDERTRQRAFEPFYSTKFLGRGLGLSLAYGIVRNHAGAIRIDSVAGEGTGVQVYLPAASEGEGRYG